jgi:hypothetical protein
MHIKSNSKQFGTNKNIIYSSILLTIALCIGVYLISTTVIIAKDGVTFIEYAKKLTSEPFKTISSEDQHPGYPFLIFIGHQIATTAYGGSSLWSWIYSAQVMTFIFRLLTIAVLYFVGKEIVGPKLGFLAVLVLILLPKPAKYGIDALSDWPYLFFLVIGLLLLLRGAIDGKWWMFGFAGLAAGLGYLVRPECAQLIVYGSLWTALQLLGKKHTMAKSKAVFAMVLLLVGFLIPAGPYMKFKGAIFPKKNVLQFDVTKAQIENYDNKQDFLHSACTTALAPTDMAKAFYELIEKIGDMLMWFFLPAFLIGAYKYFRQRNWYEAQKFFTAALIALNLPLLIWLYCEYDYISGRHTLSLVVLTIFFVPIGLQTIGIWLSSFFPKGQPKRNRDPHLWFLILLIAGLVLCVPKLLKPLHADKRNYRQAAQWLEKHTEQQDVIATPDIRISFYAQRQGLNWTNGQIPTQAQYAVRVFKEKNKPIATEPMGKIEYRYVDGRNEKVSIIIYKKLPAKEPFGQKELSIPDADNGDNRF